MINPFIGQALSDGTLKTYNRAIRGFINSGGLLPCTPLMVEKYIVDKALSEAKVRVESLRVYLAAIKHWHRENNFPDPTDTPRIRNTLASIARKNGRRKVQPRPLSENEIAKLFIFLPNYNKTLKQLRDRAIVVIAIFAGYRRSMISDIEISSVHIPADKGVDISINLDRHKGDQMGEGMTSTIPYSDTHICPATWLTQYITATGRSRGRLFTSFKGSTAGNRITPYSISKIINSVLKDAGIDGELISSGTGRKSFSEICYAANISMDAVMIQAGWKKEETVKRNYLNIKRRQRGVAARGVLTVIENSVVNMNEDE